MAFYGCEFSFNGIPSSQYGLMLYDFGAPVEDGIFSSGLEISEDRTARRYRPLFYGVTQNTPLTFELTFGVNPDGIDAYEPLDRWDMAAIATWLTGQDGYRYLEIAQPDMEAMRYRCIITDLSYVTYGKMPWAMRCTVTCDSPFAYLRPVTYEIIPDTNFTEVTINSRAPVPYYPRLEYDYVYNSSLSNSAKALRIINVTDNMRNFQLGGGMLVSNQHIVIDNENEIITTDADINLYDYFNYTFFRLLPGDNELRIRGSQSSVLRMICEYPINIGG